MEALRLPAEQQLHEVLHEGVLIPLVTPAHVQLVHSRRPLRRAVLALQASGTPHLPAAVLAEDAAVVAAQMCAR